MEENALELSNCNDNCEGNTTCSADCNDDFLTRQLECPCEVSFVLFSYFLKSFVIYLDFKRLIVSVDVHVTNIPAPKQPMLQVQRPFQRQQQIPHQH